MSNQVRRDALHRLVYVILTASMTAGASLRAASLQRYSGMCDASAAIALDDRTFLIADDEQTALWIYAVDRSGTALQRIPLDIALGSGQDEGNESEVDIEGVAQIKDRIYWISSHGRNKSGVLRRDRHQLFSVQVRKSDQGFVATPVGTPFRQLAYYLAADQKLQALGLNTVLQLDKKKVKKLAPKEGGLNIEGLSETRDGDALLIGFRNPRPMGKALIVPLRNPDAVTLSHAKPDFGPPILLDLTVALEGKSPPLGIRSIAFSRQRDRYLIAAGPHDGGGPFALFQWSGRPDDPPQLLRSATDAILRLPDFTPESLVVYERDDRIQVFSDDGSLEVPVASAAECKKGAFHAGRCEAKDLLDHQRKTFRSIFVTLD